MCINWAFDWSLAMNYHVNEMYSYRIIQLAGLNLSHICACPRPGPRFPTPYSVLFCFFYVQWDKMRGDCLRCWYWRNCWPWLFKLSFHNIQDHWRNIAIVVLCDIGYIQNVYKNVVFLYHLNDLSHNMVNIHTQAYEHWNQFCMLHFHLST